MSQEFAGKVVIVTGGSSGIGRATAVMFVKRGATVALSGRDSKKLDESAKECAKVSQRPEGDFLKVPGDIANHAVRKELVEKTVKKYGRVDVLVNGAGVLLQQRDALDADEAGFDRINNINLKAAYFMSQVAAPYLEKSKGSIVNISSISSQIVAPNFLIYAMFKGAMDHMTRTMALGIAAKGIRVNAVNPSLIPNTGIGRNVSDSADGSGKRKYMESETAKHVLHGILGTPDDIAKAICFLASDDAKFITGQCVNVDGGRTFMGAPE